MWFGYSRKLDSHLIPRHWVVVVGSLHEHPGDLPGPSLSPLLSIAQKYVRSGVNTTIMIMENVVHRIRLTRMCGEVQVAK